MKNNNNNKLIDDFFKNLEKTVNILESEAEKNKEYIEKRFSEHNNNIKKVKAELLKQIENSNLQPNPCKDFFP